MSENKTSTCCTCGYSWQTGMNAGHSCSDTLLEKVANLEKAICVYARDKMVVSHFRTDAEVVKYFVKCANQFGKLITQR